MGEDIQTPQKGPSWDSNPAPWLYFECPTVLELHWTVSIQSHCDWKGQVKSWTLMSGLIIRLRVKRHHFNPAVLINALSQPFQWKLMLSGETFFKESDALWETFSSSFLNGWRHSATVVFLSCNSPTAEKTRGSKRFWWNCDRCHWWRINMNAELKDHLFCS